MHLILLAALLSLCSLAQHSEQPQKESSSDLRSSQILFGVEDLKADKSIKLERTPNFDHFLRMKEREREEVIRKVDSKEAKRLEMDFASRFLKCQYELETLPGECKVNLRLVLKGESQDLCKKDEKKSQEMEPFIQALSKRF